MRDSISYHHLISEHDAIEAAAMQVIADLDGADTLDSIVYGSLDTLARLVRNHLAGEEDILTHLDQKHLTGPWVQAWMAAAKEFDALKADWLSFLDEWDLAAIERQRSSFATRARAILGRLNERVRFETSIFYAAALQSGAIRLK